MFVAGWLVMAAAMMLHSTVPSGEGGRFLAGFGALWAVVGAALLSVDTVVHDLVDGVPALNDRRWLVAAALLVVAGTLQLQVSTRSLPPAPAAAGSGVGDGWRQGVRSLTTDGPLMLVMFGAGSSVALMALLTVALTAQRSTRFGPLVSIATGVALLAAATFVLLSP